MIRKRLAIGEVLLRHLYKVTFSGTPQSMPLMWNSSLTSSLDDTNIFTLMKCIQRWTNCEPEKTKIASKFYQKILSPIVWLLKWSQHGILKELSRYWGMGQNLLFNIPREHLFYTFIAVHLKSLLSNGTFKRSRRYNREQNRGWKLEGFFLRDRRGNVKQLTSLSDSLITRTVRRISILTSF